jgi:hypothetical protein
MFADTVRGTLELPTEFTHTFLEFEEQFRLRRMFANLAAQLLEISGSYTRIYIYANIPGIRRTNSFTRNVC